MPVLEKIVHDAIVARLATYGSFTIPELASDTGTSVTTINNIVSSMTNEGILEIKSAVSTGKRGRKALLYCLNDKKSRYFLGIDVKRDRVIMTMIDLTCNILAEKVDKNFRYENSMSKLEEVCAMAEDFISSNHAENCILGAAMILGGRVNSKKGTSASRFWLESLEDTPLADHLSERMGFPVIIENDTKAMAFAEYSTLGKKNDCLIYVNFGWGLGMSTIIDGNIFSGTNGYAGEFGHCHYYENNIVCECGKKGCIETEVSGHAIHRKLLERIKAGESSILAGRCLTEGMIDMSDIILAAEKEDPLCIDLITKAGSELGLHISNLINIFNPSQIIIGGEFSRAAAYYFFHPIEASIRRYSLKLMSKGVPIIQARLGENAGALGGCLLARKRAIKNMESILLIEPSSDLQIKNI